MCGRYAVFDVGNLKGRFGVQNELKDFTPTHNATPGMNLPVIIKQSPTQVTLMRWGLIPNWARDPKIGYKMINARAETVAEKPAFKPLLREKRCVVPINGFYEWQNLRQTRQPYYFSAPQEKVLALAGLWDEWRDPENRKLGTFTIITTAAIGEVAKIHDRMPVILEAKQLDTWLDKNFADVTLLKAILTTKQTPLSVERIDKWP